MDQDFPAAHSMDTEWFAVDAKGHVGMFVTGEDGMVPRICLADAEPPDVPQDARAGLFLYEYCEATTPDLIEPYRREYTPETPLHVDQLPPALRKLIKRVGMPSTDFSTNEYVQPMEHVECEWWSEYIAYLAGDGKTVKPMPGREAEFAEFCRVVRTRFPDETKGLIFEEVKVEPPAKPNPKPRRTK